MTVTNKILGGLIAVLVVGVGFLVSRGKPQAQAQETRAEAVKAEPESQTPGERVRKAQVPQDAGGAKSPEPGAGGGLEVLESPGGAGDGLVEKAMSFQKLSILGQERKVLVLKPTLAGEPDYVAFDRGIFPPEFQTLIKGMDEKKAKSVNIRTREYKMRVKANKYKGRSQFIIEEFK